MEKFRYGPLVWNSIIDEDDSGNFFWNGLPPVAYDADGIPIDRLGNQCLPGDCILHIDFVPTNPEWNETLRCKLPTFEEARSWFDDQYIEVSDRNIYMFILRWYINQKTTDNRWKLVKRPVDWMIKRIWPHVELTS